MQEQDGPSLDLALLVTLVLGGAVLLSFGWRLGWPALVVLGALGPTAVAALLGWMAFAGGDPWRRPRIGQALFALLVLYGAVMTLGFLFVLVRVIFALLRGEEVNGGVLLLVAAFALPLLLQALAAILGVLRRGLERRAALRLALRWTLRFVGLSVLFGLPLGLLAFLFFVLLGGQPGDLPWLYAGAAATVFAFFAVWFWRERDATGL
jgi:hypothetical protein